ncbi:MAG: CotH kinase family protein [Bacteroidia bacterium]|jgi:gliding motility-associated-like protein|nr:CotH kinase family protein [Bacteroidia bacterium]
MHKLFLLSLLVFTSTISRAQLFINEYSCANINGQADNFGEYHDWFEIYNAGTAAVNLAGYYITDNDNNLTKWQIPSGSVSAGGVTRIICSGRGIIFSGWIHAGFKLTQCKPEEIVISDASGTMLDSVKLRRHQQGHSWGRTTNGANTWNIFTNPTFGASNNTGTPFQPYATTPVLSQQPGFYNSSISVTITSPDPNVTIRYTTDGSEPIPTSPVYSAAINIATTQVVRARAFSSTAGIPASFIETNTYFINSAHTVAVLSICGEGLPDLMVQGNWNDEPVTALEYFDKTGVMRTEVTGNSNKHGNDSWAYDQRGIDFVSKDQFGYNDALDWKLFRRKDRDEFQKIIIKAAANDNYPFENGGAHIRDAYCHNLSQQAGLAMDERTWEPCIVYMNGQYWGVYEIREKVDDHDFTDYYYDQSEENLQFLKTWGATWSEYGGPQAQTDWNTFVNFVTTNNMTVQANFDYVDSVYNWKSLIDYMILNSVVVSADWLNWNTAWWRGMDPNGDKKKWRYTLWDNDATFGHYINYTGIPDVSANADPCNPETLSDPGGQGHIPILNALLVNETFKQYYVNRYVDLMNTTFSCDSLLGLLDTMIAEIAPEMPRQIQRWGGSMAGWQANVTALRNFIQTRCTALVQGMMDCYDLTGPYEIILEVQPPGAGTIQLNSLDLDVFPWTGSYFGGIPIILQTEPTSPLYIFDYWEMVNIPSPNAQSDSITTDLTQADRIIAHYKTVEVLENTFVANAFSPNGDNNNEMVFVHGLVGVTEAEWVVFNRWGQQVFQTNDLSQGWNGTHNGQPCPSGVYAYMLKVTFADGKTSVKSGNITLMR